MTLANGRVVVSFGGCNYLGLASHPAVVEAVRRGLDVFGLSATASRETTGNAAPHESLERELADFLHTERALLVPDGYIANIAACQSVAGLGVSVALIDEPRARQPRRRRPDRRAPDRAVRARVPRFARPGLARGSTRGRGRDDRRRLHRRWRTRAGRRAALRDRGRRLAAH
ncbi:MAG: pyridoxal phosphate-dependent aminotransferase family protein [Planctomycetota bacterium]|nr:MAG: pyridoxal phosphate-dependent aminotransferase family protein [Planctomycetota bacterium]